MKRVRHEPGVRVLLELDHSGEDCAKPEKDKFSKVALSLNGYRHDFVDVGSMYLLVKLTLVTINITPC